RINNQYQELSSNVKDRFMIFDQGNVNKANTECMRELRKTGINFVSMYYEENYSFGLFSNYV
ncbi:MAG: hypothetical protein Q8O41_05115, partial [Candidatus Methanoperedens sp.]|nr:hypothetical protein [Candidatus Methanoperedens sp.]